MQVEAGREAGLAVCKSTGPVGRLACFEHLGARASLPAFHAVSCRLLIYDRWPSSTAIFPSTRRRRCIHTEAKDGRRSRATGYFRGNRAVRASSRSPRVVYIYVCMYIRGGRGRQAGRQPVSPRMVVAIDRFVGGCSGILGGWMLIIDSSSFSRFAHNIRFEFGHILYLREEECICNFDLIESKRV